MVTGSEPISVTFTGLFISSTALGRSDNDCNQLLRFKSEFLEGSLLSLQSHINCP